MARIPLSGGFTIMPEGEHILQIVGVEYKEAFGKLKLTMQNAAGQRHFENYQLYDKDNNPNDGALGAFAALARAATGDSDSEDIDPDDLKGCLVKAMIEHRTYENAEGVTKKATQKVPGTYWESVSDEEYDAYFDKIAAKETKAKPAPKAAPATAKKTTRDWKSILG